MNDAATKVLDMDGTEHDSRGCCGCDYGECVCGGKIHWQPVYGGHYYQCDSCEKTGITIGEVTRPRSNP